MGIFLFIVISYALSNLYAFIKILHITEAGFPFSAFLGLAIFILTISPVLIPIYANRGSERGIRIYSWIGFMWLAFLVPFFSAGLIIDFYNLAVKLYTASAADLVALFTFSPKMAFFIPLVLSLVITLIGYLEARRLTVERLEMRTDKLPKGESKIRIAQISDVHLGILVRDSMLEKVIGIIEAEEPDILISTGDLVDGPVKFISHLADRLNKITAPLGKYAVIGNHELYGGLKQTTKFITDAGFELLRNRGLSVNNTINIAGMDFQGGEARKPGNSESDKPEEEVLGELPPELFTLLLKHRSDVEEKSAGLFDLQLSGHTHKGQIFPMNLATMFLFKHHSGFTQLSGGSAIYVSRGTGTAGPPVRFLSTPEVTIIDIVNRSYRS